MKSNEANYILSYFLSKGSFHFVNNKGISYKIDSCIIQTVKDRGKMLSFDYYFDHNTGEVSPSEISVDRPNVACVASVSVRFRSKERGTRVKDLDRAKNGASKRAGRGWGRNEGNACRQTPRFWKPPTWLVKPEFTHRHLMLSSAVIIDL